MKKEIMKRAWQIKKENNDNIFALCLKMAWAESKVETTTTEWIQVKINKNNIKTETAKALLIKLIGSEEKFWVSKKLVRSLNGSLISVSMKNDFEVKVFQNGNGKYNRYEVVSERTVSASSIAKIYNNVA